ncbi:MAG: SBBP repeat-containing protein [Bacteroidia bacterium]
MHFLLLGWNFSKSVRENENKLKNLHLLLMSIIVLISGYSRAQNLEWAKKMGGPLVDNANSIGLDSQGNVYTAGVFSGTADFDPGPGSSLLSSEGGSDVFVTKFDNAGNLLWAKQFGGANDDLAAEGDIAVDSAGNVLITGYFSGTVDFDPGAGIFNLNTLLVSSVHANDVFITKLDAAGNFVWAKQFRGNANSYALSLEIDDVGNIYTTGQYAGVVDFDPGAGISNLICACPTCAEIFVSKLDTDGNFVWAKRMVSIDGPGFDDGFGLGTALDIDESGNVYLSGYFGGEVDFDPGAGSFNLYCVAFNFFILKLNSSGNFLWAKQIGGVGNDLAHDLVLDSFGNIIITGRFDGGGTVDFDPGAGVFELTTSNTNLYTTDVFVLKLDADGNFVWAKQFGSPNGVETGLCLEVDVAGNIFFTGCFSGTADFDPGPGTSILTAANFDIFVSKLDPAGNYIWAAKMGGAEYDTPMGIFRDNGGNIYVNGFFRGTADFNPGADVFELSSAGENEIFVLKLSDGSLSLSIEQQEDVSCFGLNDGSITFNVVGGSAPYTYSWTPAVSSSETASGLAPGTYTLTVTDALGLSSTLSAAITEPSQLIIDETITNLICDSTFGSISTVVVGGTGPYTYSWTPDGDNSATINDLLAGTYGLTVTDSAGCTALGSYTVVNTGSLLISVTPASATILLGDSIQLEASGASTYSWTNAGSLNCSDCQLVLASPTSTTSYIVTGNDEYGCVGTAEVKITVDYDCKEVFIPSIFSPNGKGPQTNEAFCVFSDCVAQFKLVIHNRWGEQVFLTEDITQCWDGTFKGVEAATGVYAYNVYLKQLDGRVLSKTGTMVLAK